ncbi:hypothetical protein H5410_051428 [Solanum commersonii]|uniref:Uncharacterized protein n=1 Tax=Solanum commersonii TaxID=4109 RepID=A0A9J5WY55_SOLCO|nr:hypothetical protein H5410_051428 [Solanum commersonii]
MLRHDHKPSHEPWSRSLAVKRLVVPGPVAWPQGLASHKAKALSQGVPRVVVKITGRGGGHEVRAMLAKCLWLGVLAPTMLKHDHEPSHEPWSRPMVVK